MFPSRILVAFSNARDEVEEHLEGGSFPGSVAVCSMCSQPVVLVHSGPCRRCYTLTVSWFPDGTNDIGTPTR